MGPCIAGGAYLPALSDVIIMVEKTSFMGLGGPNLVKGAVGQVVDAESLGGARMHTATSGVAHYMAKDDPDCLRAHPAKVSRVARCPRRGPKARRPPSPPRASTICCPPTTACPTTVEEVIARIFDARRLPRVPARIRPGNALRPRAPARPPGRR